jgi:hypothetical protein
VYSFLYSESLGNRRLQLGPREAGGDNIFCSELLLPLWKPSGDYGGGERKGWDVNLKVLGLKLVVPEC